RSRPEPFDVRTDHLLVVVREEVDLVELTSVECLRDRTQTNRLTLGWSPQVCPAHPRYEHSFHVRHIQKILFLNKIFCGEHTNRSTTAGATSGTAHAIHGTMPETIRSAQLEASVVCSSDEVAADIRDGRAESISLFAALDEPQREQLVLDAWSI